MPSTKTKKALAAKLEQINSTVLTFVCHPDASIQGAKPKSFEIKRLKGIHFDPEFLAFNKIATNSIYAKGEKYIETVNGRAKITNGILTDALKTYQWFLRNAATLLLTVEQRLMGESTQDSNFTELFRKAYSKNDLASITVEEERTKIMSKTLRQVKTYTRVIAIAETAKTPLAGLCDSLAKHPASIAYIAQKESIKLLAQAAKKATLALPVSQA